ncbi:hypothetical protein P280DRAFT_16998 [Massarina eburnea CBS 473.64]|uniref:Uncharacterized protein n=1 Tax=Massarina eburnea CBS 473.64 TaxID=1395130 RepID=A0A6A6SGN7_9PLEO|nr:hypothetical protein P280DRAFT_16998 [Massarina eburnea CBS 473.64]
MPDRAGNSQRASTHETSAEPQCGVSSAPPPLISGSHAGSHVADSTTPTTLPPTLTPATTTRQSISLGVLSNLWGVGPDSLPPLHAAAETSLPVIITHAPSPEAQELALDLTASIDSAPSTTTTLTDTLPPTQSAAIRALNAPAFQSHASSSTSKPAKSASSRTTLSSQPVVVRTYSGSRHGSRHPSGLGSPRYTNMNGHGRHTFSALSQGLAGRSEKLPAIEEFSFSAILRAVDPEIRDAIDAIAEICARSRMSLADEYDAHLPPQGEITSAGPVWAAGMGSLVGRGRIPRAGQGWSAEDNTLTAVPEASSSSERLSADGRSATGAGKKRSQSAYGSLKSVISGGSEKIKAVDDADPGPSTRPEQSKRGPAWSVNASSPDHPAITIVTSPQASKQLSLDTSSTITDIPEDIQGAPAARPQTAVSRQPNAHRRNTSLASLSPMRTRSSTLSSLTSWLPWPRPSSMDANSQQELTRAESRLREMLTLMQESSIGKGKAPVSVAY